MCRQMKYSRKEASMACSKTQYLISPVRLRTITNLSHKPVLWPIISLSPPPNTNGQICCSRGPCRRSYKRLLYEIWVRKPSYTRTDGNILRCSMRRAVHWQRARVCVCVCVCVQYHKHFLVRRAMYPPVTTTDPDFRTVLEQGSLTGAPPPPFHFIRPSQWAYSGYRM
jgi:hypothetical protein